MTGHSLFISGRRTIFGRDIPAEFSGFARSGIPLDAIGLEALKLPTLTLTALIVLIVVWITLEQTTYGRRLYAIGGNIEAARLAGIKVRLLRLSAFAVTGHVRG